MQHSFSSVNQVTQAYITILLEQEKAKLTNIFDLLILKGTLGDRKSTQALCFWVVDKDSNNVDGIVGILFSLLFFA